MQAWPTAVQETLDDPWAGGFQQLKVRLPGRNHTLDEAASGFWRLGRGEHTARPLELGEIGGKRAPNRRDVRRMNACFGPNPSVAASLASAARPA